MTQQVKNLTHVREDVGLIPGLAQWVKGSGVAMTNTMSVGYGCGQIWCGCGCGVGWQLQL